MKLSEYTEHNAALKAAEVMTPDERAEVVAARKLRDDTLHDWKTAKDGEARTAAHRVHERANLACTAVEAQVQAARDARRRAVKIPWQTRVDERQQRSIEAIAPIRIRVLDGR